MDMRKPENHPLLTNELVNRPTIEHYRIIMGYPNWNHMTQLFIYLREFDIGLQAAIFLLKFTESFKDKLSEEEIRQNRYLLWYFYLKLLDKSDYWEEFIETWDKLRLDSTIQHPHSNRHILDDLYWEKRQGIIQRKIERQKEGKSVQHLKHSQVNELAEDEYHRRIEVIKYWFEYGSTFDERMREMFKKKLTSAKSGH